MLKVYTFISIFKCERERRSIFFLWKQIEKILSKISQELKEFVFIVTGVIDASYGNI